MSIYDGKMKVTIFCRSAAAQPITSPCSIAHCRRRRRLDSAITSLGVISCLSSQFTQRKLRRFIVDVRWWHHPAWPWISRAIVDITHFANENRIFTSQISKWWVMKRLLKCGSFIAYSETGKTTSVPHGTVGAMAMARIYPTWRQVKWRRQWC